MDLDDSFTEKLLNRREGRRKYLSTLKTQNHNSVKRYAETESLEPLQDKVGNRVLKESPKRHCPSPSSTEDDKENLDISTDDEQEEFVPLATAASKGLAALRNKDCHDSTNTLGSSGSTDASIPKAYFFSTNSTEMCDVSRKSRLASLAANINHWEDDVKPFDPTNIGSKYRSTNANSASTNTSSSVHKINRPVEKVVRFNPTSSDSKSALGGVISSKSAKSSVWEHAIQAALETEAISKSAVKLQNSAKEFSESKAINISKNVDVNQNQESQIQRGSENVSKPPDNIDPASLPLAARKALFEKALFGGNHQLTQETVEPKLSVAQRAALFEKAANPKAKQIPSFQSQRRFPPSPSKVPVSSVVPSSPIKGPSFMAKQDSRISLEDFRKESPKKLNIVSSPVKVHQNQVPPVTVPIDIKTETVEKKSDLSSLVSHWEKLSSGSSKKDSNSDEDPTVNDTELFVNNTSVTESYERSYEDDSANDYSEGIPESNVENETQDQLEESFESEEESVDGHMEEESVDDHVEEESVDDHVEEDVFKRPMLIHQPAELSIISEHTDYSDVYNSTTMDNKSVSPNWQSQENIATRELSKSASYSSYDASEGSCSSGGIDSESSDTRYPLEKPAAEAPLQYTVSFYRRQKQEKRTPPLKTIIRREAVPSTILEKDEERTVVIQKRIILLEEEIKRQQAVIGQTSQALNLCHATSEFSGSAEQVEGERLLLIATQKRQAMLNEIQRLKTLGAQGDGISDGTGTLTVSGIRLPLKREFMAAQLEGRNGDAVHCFLCLIRHGAQVIVTQMMSTEDTISDGALCFTNHITLQNLPHDFSVVFEVYALQTKKEVLPHDKKYHIKRENKVRITPKGKKNDGRMLLPTISSPGGPHAVRSPSFGVVGYTRFLIQNCNKNIFTLDKVPYSSPLEGVLGVKLQLRAEHKVVETGFLTMFEDVSGFGAWQRRWCALDSHHLSFWKFPGDEQKKEPIGVIDLRNCVTGSIKLLPRDICARPHTFQIVTIRPQEKGDRETLITSSANTMTTTKHMLSADTKEERVLWCDKLNEALINVRKWNPSAIRPLAKGRDF